jgi:D-glycero-alpha-D-manno-heptose-7-phosphate kinase
MIHWYPADTTANVGNRGRVIGSSITLGFVNPKGTGHKSKVADSEVLRDIYFTNDIEMRSKQALEAGDLVEFGRVMNVHRESKKRRSGGISNGKIDECYNCAMSKGALGGKVIGAGGGGFLMFYAGDKPKLCHAMCEHGLKEVRFRFDFEGTRVVSSD